MLMPLITALAWLAIPAGLACIVDDWFLRPRRQVRAGEAAGRDPPVIALAYYALPVLVVAAVVRLLAAETLDFSLVLFIIAVVTGIVWLIDALLLRKHRVALARESGKDPSVISEPGTVDYARSFFPVVVIVLLLRSFLFEPFRIPPDSSVNYIKRLVGLPGDRVAVQNDEVILNGKPVATAYRGLYDDGCYEGMHLMEETLDHHPHAMMYCPATGDIAAEPLPTCNRNMPRGYVCPASSDFPPEEHGDWPEHVIPPGMYFMMGDNRDNSADSRYWGFVPEANLIGKATRIWFNWDLKRKGGPMWKRIGMRIQ